MVVFIDKVQHFWPSQNNINKLSWRRKNGVLSSLIGERVITPRRGNDASFTNRHVSFPLSYYLSFQISLL